MVRPLSAWWTAREWRSRTDIERDIDDEIGFHIDMRASELVQAGWDAADAERAARGRFGDVARVKRTCRTVQMGERVMLQRFHLVLLAILVVAVVAVGWQSIAAQSTSRDQIDRMSDEIRGLTAALRSLPAAGSSPASFLGAAGPAREPLLHANPGRADPEQVGAKAFDLETESARWLARFDGTDSWRAGLALGNEVAELPPDESLAILQRIWTRIPRTDSRQQLLKGFVFGGGRSNACEVLHLAATDREFDVQRWAFLYLKTFALRDFNEHPAEYAAWRATSAGRPIGDVLAESTEAFLSRLRTGSESEVRAALELATRADQRAFSQHLSPQDLHAWRSGALGEAARLATQGDDDARVEALQLAAQVGIDETFRLATIEPLLAADSRASAEVRAAAVRALEKVPFEGRAARLIQLFQEASQGSSGADDPVASAAISALIGTKDARAIPDLVALMARADEPGARAQIGSALHSLTGVRRDDAHDAQFWLQWLDANRERLPRESSADRPGREGDE